MPSCSTAKNPRDITITFTEEDHKYSSIINDEEITYISGTTFISKFFSPFDPTGIITKKCAQKRGLTVEALKQEWKEKADKSCVYGTKIHETMEDCLLGRTKRNKPIDLKEKLAMKNAERLSAKLLTKLEILGIEKIIFDERLKLAGTIDLLARAKKDGKIYILDHKTNGYIDVENKYNKFGLPPIKHIPDTNFWHYTIQLNLYQYILKESGYIDKNEKIGMCLFHITENGVKTYTCDDRQKEISDMIELYKEGKVK